MNFVAWILSGTVDLVTVVSVVLDPVKVAVADIDLAPVVVAEFVNSASGLVAKNFLETRLEGNLREVLRKQRGL